MKKRIDILLVEKGLAATRSQAQSLIMAGRVSVDGRRFEKPGMSIDEASEIEVSKGNRYVSRGGLKLESVAEKLNLDFTDKIVLDVGSSTGGFTDYALQHGASKVYAVDVGTNQLDYKLRQDKRVVVMEKTDIRKVTLPELADMAVIDVSFISMRLVLPSTFRNIRSKGLVVAMVKPQFEAGVKEASKHKGVIKNDTIRRGILKEFEAWVSQSYRILGKADSEVTGAKGNRERFYLLQS